MEDEKMTKKERKELHDNLYKYAHMVADNEKGFIEDGWVTIIGSANTKTGEIKAMISVGETETMTQMLMPTVTKIVSYMKQEIGL